MRDIKKLHDRINDNENMPQQHFRKRDSFSVRVVYHLYKLCISKLTVYALIQMLYVKSIFPLIYKYLVLTLFDKIRTCFEILAAKQVLM